MKAGGIFDILKKMAFIGSVNVHFIKKGQVIGMNAGMIMGLVIISIVAGIMIIIGIFQFSKKDNPVGFYNVIDPPKKEEISDVIQWNRKHGIIWIVYGICIEFGFWLGYVMPVEVLEMVFMMGGVIIPLPFMVIRHRKLEKEYKT